MSFETGTREWNDRAERAEWAFVAKILSETLLQKSLYSQAMVGAVKLAKARSKSGWRSVKDIETLPAALSNDELVLENEMLKNALRNIRDLDNITDVVGFSGAALMGTVHLMGEISRTALGGSNDTV